MLLDPDPHSRYGSGSGLNECESRWIRTRSTYKPPQIGCTEVKFLGPSVLYCKLPIRPVKKCSDPKATPCVKYIRWKIHVRYLGAVDWTGRQARLRAPGFWTRSAGSGRLPPPSRIISQGSLKEKMENYGTQLFKKITLKIM
jgi:hypothetical protein